MNKTGKIFRGSMDESELNEEDKPLIAHYRKMPRDMQVAFDTSFKFLSES